MSPSSIHARHELLEGLQLFCVAVSSGCNFAPVYYVIESYQTSFKPNPFTMLCGGTLILLYFIILTMYGISGVGWDWSEWGEADHSGVDWSGKDEIIDVT